MLGGLYDRNEKENFFLGTDIFVFPSNREAFPLVNLEAMASGCAVISTNEGAIPELVVDGITGHLVEKNDHENLAFLLSELICDPDKFINFGNNGRKRVIDNFTLDHNVNGLEKILSSLLNN